MEEYTNEKEIYKKKIIDMIEQIDNIKYIKMIFSFANTLFKEERAGK